MYDIISCRQFIVSLLAAILPAVAFGQYPNYYPSTDYSAAGDSCCPPGGTPYYQPTPGRPYDSTTQGDRGMGGQTQQGSTSSDPSQLADSLVTDQGTAGDTANLASGASSSSDSSSQFAATAFSQPTAAPNTGAPNMIGDFFGGAGSVITIQPPNVPKPFMPFTTNFTLPAVAGDPILFTTDNPFVSETLIFSTMVDVMMTPVPVTLVNTDEATAAFITYGNTPDSAADVNLQMQQAVIIAQNGGGKFIDPPAVVTNVQFPGQPTAVRDAQNDLFVTLPVSFEYSSQEFMPPAQSFIIPNPSAGDIVGRVRLQDNNIALPQDRIFFDYNNFTNVPLTATGVDVNRYEPGFEKTFFGGNSSVEVRVPMATTLDSDIALNGVTNSSEFEFGNVCIAPKVLLESSDLATAVGLGVSIPTADDVNVTRMGDEFLQIENESVHLIPYIACFMPPIVGDDFAHMFVTADFDPNGNTVYANVDGNGLEKIGKWSDQHLISVDAAYGSWLFRKFNGKWQTSGFAWSAELHYTANLNDADSVTFVDPESNSITLGDPLASISVLNGTIGCHANIGNTFVTVAYSVPVTDEDRVFDGQLRVFVNRYLY